MTTFVRLQTKYWNGPFWLKKDGTTIGGGRCIRHADDQILEYCEAVNWDDLDWTQTTLHRPESRAGWIAPDGRYFGCEDHDLFAWLALKQPVKNLEKTGWAKVYYNRFKCFRRLTAEQRNTLSRRGYKIEDND